MRDRPLQFTLSFANLVVVVLIGFSTPQPTSTIISAVQTLSCNPIPLGSAVFERTTRSAFMAAVRRMPLHLHEGCALISSIYYKGQPLLL